MGQLIAARGAQGVFGGAIQAVTFAILADIITPRERGRYIGIYVGASTVAAIAGPLLGGVIVDAAGWRWTFLINLPLGVLALVGSARFLPLPHTTRHASLDVRGAALLSVGIARAARRARAGARRMAAPAHPRAHRRGAGPHPDLLAT